MDFELVFLFMLQWNFFNEVFLPNNIMVRKELAEFARFLSCCNASLLH